MTGRRALVTGGASGIGFATANLLRREGAKVALLDRNKEATERAAGELDAFALVSDVMDPACVADSVAEGARRLDGPVDVLVNAAAIYRIRPLLDLGPEEWDEVLGINLRGTYLVGREVAGALIGAGAPGAIVNISSTAGLIADAQEPGAHYNASKAGVISLTKQMAVEWATHRIRVNAVCPGVIDTPMLRLMDDPQAGRRYLQERVPLRRLGLPEEVAAIIVFLASEEASYLTGVAVPIDGGATAV
jgi:NAD(P)-dependent dehydrogenase (short-subunit alcohol dehydrogenase family)